MVSASEVGKDREKTHMFADDVKFEDFDLSEPLLKSLEKCGFTSPTVVQKKVLPATLRATEDIVIASETGSGKTLSYLLPVIDEFVRKRERDPDVKAHVRALVLVPSQELTAQIMRFVDQLNLGVKATVLAGERFTVPPDTLIVASTPRAFGDRAELHDFADLRCIVVDEADMLLEGSFKDETTRVLDTFRKPLSRRKIVEMERRGEEFSSHPQPGQPHLIFVGATYPHWIGDKVRSVVRFIEKRYPDVLNIRTDFIHRSNPLLTETWIDTQGIDTVEKLVEVVKGGPPGQVMVFCNTVKSVDMIAEALSSSPSVLGGVQAVHRSMQMSDRIRILDEFRENKFRVLVCTDLVARGMDLGSNVSHVIQYEFGPNVVNYLHRIGRTARAGYSGQATHFYDGEQRALAEDIIRANRTGLEAMFSRNRNFRNRKKKQFRRENPDQYDRGAHRRKYAHLMNQDVDDDERDLEQTHSEETDDVNNTGKRSSRSSDDDDWV